ncbi:MAG: type II toxin-antitoxin system Phd/YefM family antitoxin, partial [Nitrosomonas sp.]
MKIYTIYNAKTHLSQLIEQACAGEEVVIAKGKNAVVKLVPVGSEPDKRQFVVMRGKAR